MRLEKEIGSIEKGKKADITILDVKKSCYFPILKESIINHLVYTAQGSHVSTVMINGKIVMQDRQLKTFDEDIVIEKAQVEAKEFVAKFLHY